MSEIILTFGPEWEADAALRIQDITNRASPVLEKLLGPAVPGVWQALRTSEELQFSEINFRTKQIAFDISLKPYEIIHEFIHAWTGMDLRYSVIEEGITLAATGFVCQELNVIDEIGSVVAMGTQLRQMLIMDPRFLIDVFPEFNMFRYAVARQAWMIAEHSTPGALRSLVAVLREMDKTASITDYLTRVQRITPDAFAILNREFFEGHHRLLIQNAQQPQVIPYLVWGLFGKTLRIVAGAKQPSFFVDNGEKIPAYVDTIASASAHVALQGVGATVNMDLQLADAAVNLDLAQLPAGDYQGTLTANGQIMDTIAFTINA